MSSRRKKLGKYLLGEKLGEGTFSTVYLAEDLATGEQYALKMIEIAQVQRENMEEQLRREIAITKKMKHPHIVEMREVFKTSNHINIVLEFVRGGELFDKIVERKYFGENRARRYFQQLILGLQYCHRHGVAHRDLKPENLLLDDNDNLKITDFGLSAIVPKNDASTLKTTCGTPHYVAPEVLTEKGYDGTRADIWSCGIILFVMLTGKLPFEDNNMRGLFKKIRSGKFLYPEHVSEGARRIISGMLVPDVMKRSSIEDIMEDPWFRINLELVNGREVSETTEEDLVSAVDETEEQILVAETQQQTHELTAFDLASRLMTGRLAPLLGGGPPPVRSKTKFLVSCSVSTTLERMQSFIEMEYLAVDRLDSEGYLLKCLRYEPELLTFTVHVFPTVSPTLSFVEMRRGKGDRLDLNRLYRSLLRVVKKNKPPRRDVDRDSPLHSTEASTSSSPSTSGHL